jgi:hypothetical protein
MTTDIMELWQQIAAGALPEGVTVKSCDIFQGYKVWQRGQDTCMINANDVDTDHRAAMLLIVDGWERQEWQFVREKVNASYDWLAFSKEWEEDSDKYFQHSHEREIIALGNVLAKLGRAVKEGQS